MRRITMAQLTTELPCRPAPECHLGEKRCQAPTRKSSGPTSAWWTVGDRDADWCSPD